jgi:hypothetical protein
MQLPKDGVRRRLGFVAPNDQRQIPQQHQVELQAAVALRNGTINQSLQPSEPAKSPKPEHEVNPRSGHEGDSDAPRR